MRMLSAPVLLGAALCSSPALYQGFVTQTVPVELAASRFAVALVIAWVAMSAVAMLIGEPPKPEVEEPSALDETVPLEAVAPVEPEVAPAGEAPQAA
jgi:hypothetical protein